VSQKTANKYSKAGAGWWRQIGCSRRAGGRAAAAAPVLLMCGYYAPGRVVDKINTYFCRFALLLKRRQGVRRS